MAAKDAAIKAQKEGAKSAKLATWKAKHMIGPIISSGWDFFEAIYYGGTMTEGFLRDTGTSFGLHAGGFYGEQRFGRFGYLVGSQLGSWVGALEVGLDLWYMMWLMECITWFSLFKLQKVLFVKHRPMKNLKLLRT
ncbi:hypothetical protein SO802_013871 [Lithocarpus litseifolius]|uniref:Uncharacterized protein n=1 Tax=Lithocarpus litseifolius TaxID=425828 RepID=A0AAW2DAR5_9ROSI